MKKIVNSVVIGVVITGILLGGVFINKGQKVKADNVTNIDYTMKRRTDLKVDNNGKLQVTRNHPGDEPMGKEDSWTLFVYMCGSDLESEGQAASIDIKEMLSASESENVNIIIQTGGSNEWNKPYIESDKIGRYIIKDNKLELIETHPEANMGDYKTLKSFLKWGIKTYPAENMGLILWNHGGGPVGGVCYNERHDYDSLSLSEIELALENVSKNMTDKFQMIGFDTCLMSSIETANKLVPYADYMVASEQSESCDGWEYKSVVNALVENPDIKGDSFGRAIVDGFMKNVRENEDKEDEYSTLAVLDLSKVDDVLIAFNDVARNMDEITVDNSVIRQLTKEANDSIAVGSGDSDFGLVDLYDYMSRISSMVQGTNQVMSAIENLTIYEQHGLDSSNAHGVTFYYPVCATEFHNLIKMKNVITSPYYMNFIDKMEYYHNFVYNDMKEKGYFDFDEGMENIQQLGEYEESEYKLENYKDNNWENSSYFDEDTFEYMEYEFESLEEYKELRDLPYYKNVEFDDNWYEIYFK